MKKIALILLTTLFLWSCTDNGPAGPDVDDFDREAILVNWADNIIIPSFENLAGQTEELKTASETFSADPTQQNLTNLREQWLESYKAWQHVSMFEMGKAMEIRFRDNMNIYPTDADEIQDNIEGGSYNLELPSLNDSQGFPALDYLLYGLADSDDELLSYYTTNENADAYKTYVTDLTIRIDTLTNTVLDEWTTGFRDEFVNNTGSGANSSLDMMVNDYIFYYEKYLRAGKIGIPAGVSNISSGTPSIKHVEAYYSEEYSKVLFSEALTASINFFNGTHFDKNQDGQSLDDYLNYLNAMKEGTGTNLTTLINNQFETAREEAEVLNDNFAAQIETDNSLMLSTYDQIQRNVVYLKVDMVQALNISVDYQDADGD